MTGAIKGAIIEELAHWRRCAEEIGASDGHAMVEDVKRLKAEIARLKDDRDDLEATIDKADEHTAMLMKRLEAKDAILRQLAEDGRLWVSAIDLQDAGIELNCLKDENPKADTRRREREAVAWTLTELTREHALPLGVASLNAEAFAAALNGRYPEVTP